MWQQLKLATANAEVEGGVFEEYMQWDQLDWETIWENTLDTLYMTGFSILLVIIFGIILGLLLCHLSN